MAIERIVDRIVDRLPYSDGSARRRFIAGALVIGAAALSSPEALKAVIGLTIQDILGSPMLTAAVGLVVYLTGTVVEMLGSLFLIPLAGLVFRPLGSMIPVAHDLLLANHLSESAKNTYATLPERIQLGIERRGTRHCDLAIELFPRLLTTPQNRRWARNAFGRARDVGAITTALITMVLVVAVAKTLSLQDSTAGERYERALGDTATEWRSISTTLEQVGSLFVDGLPPVTRDDLRSLFYPRPDSASAPTADSIAHFLNTPIDLRARPPSAPLTTYIDPATVERYIVGLRRIVQQAVARIDAVHIRRPDAQPAPAQSPFTEPIAAWHKRVELAMLDWKSAADALEREIQERRNLAFGLAGALPVLLLLYAGYFLSLRNAFLNGIEARAIEIALGPPVASDATDLLKAV